MISATVLTKNAERTLEKTLESLKRFPEVIIADTGSTDRTLQIAALFPNVRIVSFPFEGFGKAHNLASSCASHDWILSIDSDEVLSPSLSDEILSCALDPGCVYFLDRHNFFQGKRIKAGGGWHPDPVLRLYHRQKTQFGSERVHEKIQTKGLRTSSFKAPLYHTPYLSIEDFLAKMQLYSTLFAEQSDKKSSLAKALFHGFAALFKSYFLKRGFLAGKEGLIISIYNGHTAYYKYLKLAYKKKER